MKKTALLIFWLLGVAPAAAGVSCSLPFNLTNGTIADATQVMANYNSLVTCLANAAAAGVNSDITALTALNTPITPVGGGSTLYVGGTSTGSANAQVVSALVPSGFSLSNGNQVLFRAGSGFTNAGGGTTLNVNGTGATAVTVQTPSGPQPLVGGEIQANELTLAVFSTSDNTFHLKSIDTQLGGIGPVTAIASATTTDLSLANSHLASITGTTTITSFGSNANINFPIYRVTFTGSLTLTYNATNLILPGAANITTAANDAAVALYLGSGNWQIISYQRANGAPVVGAASLCGFNNLLIVNNAGTPNTNIDASASSATVNNGTASFNGTSVSFTMNLTTGTVTSTANGMDGEARPTSGWVYLYMISNGVTMAGLGSSSSTSPTLPAGFPYSCYMGAMQTDGSANLFRSRLTGNLGNYVITASTNTANFGSAPLNITSGNTGGYSNTSPTATSAQVTGNTKCAPLTARSVLIVANNAYKAGTNANILVAPSSGYFGTNNGPAGSNGMAWPLFVNNSTGAGTNNLSAGTWLMLESNSVSWASDASGASINCGGWRDAVNAN